MILHIHHLKDPYFALPPEKQAELMAGAITLLTNTSRTVKRKHHMRFLMVREARPSGMFLSEEMMQLYMEYPLTPYIDAQIIPVAELYYGCCQNIERNDRKGKEIRLESKS